MKRQNLKYYLALALALTISTLYLPALGNGFVNWDDTDLVINNTYIRSINLPFLRWAFALQNTYSANWHPLTWISHALDYAAWGLNPLGHHLTSIILHAINTFLVVLLMVRLIESSNPESPVPSPQSRFTLIAAGVTGLLFGLHPLHVEPVAWASARADLLCALFYLLSVMEYVKYAGRGNPLWLPFFGRPQGAAPTRPYFLSLLFFILALMSKPMAVSLPAVFLILDWYPFGRIRSLKTFLSAFIEKLPFIVLSIGSAILTILAQKAGGTMELMESIPLSARLLLAPKAVIAYLWKMILPLHLIPYYPYPEKISLMYLEYFLPLILIVGISATCIFFAKKQRLWLSVWVYYIVSLIPVLGIVQVGKQAMADRYTYLPGLGPFLIMGLIVAWGLTQAKTFNRWALVLRSLSAIVAIFVLISISYLTFEQIGIWKNTFSLWTYVIEKGPERVPIAYMNRGKAFYKMGQLNKAMEDYDMAITLRPSDPNYYFNRGLVFADMGRFDRAIADYNRAIVLDQQGAENFVGRPFCFLARGLAHLAIGQRGPAISDLKRSCELGSDIGCNELQRLFGSGF